MEKILATLSYDNTMEDGEDGYYDNEFIFNDFCDEVAYALKSSKIKNKVVLVARNSNWRGGTGLTMCKFDARTIVSKVLSFGNDECELCKDGHKLYFKTASHDVPMGFRIELVSATKYIDSDGSFNSEKAFKDLE